MTPQALLEMRDLLIWCDICLPTFAAVNHYQPNILNIDFQPFYKGSPVIERKIYMFHKILVAMDRSEIGKHVFDQALSLAKATRATLMLLYVLSHDEQGTPKTPLLYSLDYHTTMSGETLEIYQEQWKTFEERGLELLRSRANEAIAAGVNVEFTQSAGSPGRNICDLARTWKSDLIVMGRRGHSGFNELILGSVSNYVLHHAPCSVLVVQGLVLPSAQPIPKSEVTQHGFGVR